MLIGILTWILCSSNIKAQVNEHKSNFYIDIGAKYTPIEYLGGPSIGLHYQDCSQKFSFGLRKDFILSIGKFDMENSPYQLTRFNTYNYIDIFYSVKSDIKMGTGLGWIYEGGGENLKLNKEYGYPSASVIFQYKVSWFYAEIRGDIPLEKRRSEIDQGHLFPVSVALIYSFIPGNN